MVNPLQSLSDVVQSDNLQDKCSCHSTNGQMILCTILFDDGLGTNSLNIGHIVRIWLQC